MASKPCGTCWVLVIIRGLPLLKKKENHHNFAKVDFSLLQLDQSPIFAQMNVFILFFVWFGFFCNDKNISAERLRLPQRMMYDMEKAQRGTRTKEYLQKHSYFMKAVIYLGEGSGERWKN